jgi:cytochrome c oxidase accessory protein FixG
MLDRNSIVVAYDWVRGEPRGKIRKQKNEGARSSRDLLASMAVTATAESAAPAPELGDCIDCKMCIYVCPTGIDIRNGTQLECVNCTACIDACDEIMDKVDRPRGLIRYDSIEGITTGRKKIMTPRVYAYSALLFVLLAVNVVVLGFRSSVEAILLRTPGMLFQETEDGYISNLYNFQLINKTADTSVVTFHLLNSEGRIRYVGQEPRLIPEEVSKGALFIDIPRDKIEDRKTVIELELRKGDEVIDHTSTSFLGPKN